MHLKRIDLAAKLKWSNTMGAQKEKSRWKHPDIFIIVDFPCLLEACPKTRVLSTYGYERPLVKLLRLETEISCSLK